MSARDLRDHHVQPGAVGQHCVDKWRAQVDSPARAAQHSLDEIGDCIAGEDERRQLGPPAPRHEDPTRFVDPDLLDLRIIEERLQRSEARYGVDDEASDLRRIVNRRQRRGDRSISVVADDLVHELANRAALGDRVDPAAPDELAHLVLDDRLRGRQSCFSSPPAPGS
jgi:hypothetical protein